MICEEMQSEYFSFLTVTEIGAYLLENPYPTKQKKKKIDFYWV